jgi:hypothetical protein
MARTTTGGGRCSLHPVERGSAGLVTTHRAREPEVRAVAKRQPTMRSNAIRRNASTVNDSHSARRHRRLHRMWCYAATFMPPGVPNQSVSSSDCCNGGSRGLELARPARIHVSARRTYCTSVAPWLVSQFGHSGHSSSISSAPSLMLTTARRRQRRCPAAFRSSCTPQLMQYSASSNSGTAVTKFVTYVQSQC